MVLAYFLKKTTSELDPVTERIMLNAFLVLFMLVGAGFLYAEYRRIRKLRSMEPIKGVCTALLNGAGQPDPLGNSHRSHKAQRTPVWEYSYGGISYNEKDGFGLTNGSGCPEVGEERTIYIDPKHPETPYHWNKTDDEGFLFMGIMFFGVALLGIIMYNIQFV